MILANSGFLKSVLRQVDQVAFDRHADEPRVEKALVVGNDEDGPGRRHPPGSREAIAETERESRHAGDVTYVIKMSGEGRVARGEN